MSDKRKTGNETAGCLTALAGIACCVAVGLAWGAVWGWALAAALLLAWAGIAAAKGGR